MRKVLNKHVMIRKRIFLSHYSSPMCWKWMWKSVRHHLSTTEVFLTDLHLPNLQHWLVFLLFLYHKSTDVRGRYNVVMDIHFWTLPLSPPSGSYQVFVFKFWNLRKYYVGQWNMNAERFPFCVRWKSQLAASASSGSSKNVDSWAFSSQTWWIRNSKRKAQESLFYQTLQLIVKHAKCLRTTVLRNIAVGGFPGGPWLGLGLSLPRGRGSVPDWGTEIPSRTVWHGQMYCSWTK